MIKIYFIFLFSLIFSYSHSQDQFTLSEGFTTQKSYFSEIHYISVRDKIIIKASINGKNYRFILDTGAPTMITRKVFNELNLAILKKISINDANDKKDSLSIVNLNKVVLGDIIFNDVPALIAEDAFIFDCHQVDGFIGSNMLRNTIIKFLAKDQKLIITDDGIKLSLNKKYASNLFLTPSQSSPFFKLKVKGKDTGSIELLFDTGMEGMFDLSLKHYAVLEKEKIFDELAVSSGLGPFGLFGSGNSTAQYLLRVPELNINGTIFRNVSIQTTSNSNSRVGVELLKYGTVTLDYKNKKFYFEPFNNTIDLLRMHFPISFTIKNNKTIVAIVWDSNLNREVSPGDELIAVNDVNYRDIDPCDLLIKPQIFEGKTQAILTLKNSDGVIKKISMSKSIQ